ncbi:MAG: topoisomerase DNA-binding C4 zinc finger domain-containing protein, partial [Bacilli bacterium]
VDYVDKHFTPTEQGRLTTTELDKFFEQIINVDYTANMEDDLDQIANGDETSLKVLSAFYDLFAPLLENAKENMVKIPPQEIGEDCPECQHPLVLRRGRFGEFVACSNFPECRYIKKEAKEKVLTGEDCPKCGSAMVKRHSSKNNSDFEACSNYPKCRYIKPIPDVILDEDCPTCGKKLVKRQGRYGQFTCCIDYPTCKTIIKE